MSMWHLKIYLSKTKLLNFYINSALPTDFSVSVHVNTFVSLAQISSLKSLLTPFLSHSLTSNHRGAFCKKKAWLEPASSPFFLDIVMVSWCILPVAVSFLGYFESACLSCLPSLFQFLLIITSELSF